MDLVAELPKVIHMVVVDESTGTKCIINVQIQYDALPKYCKEYRFLGHNDERSRKLNHNLRNITKNAEEDKINEVIET